MGSFDATIFQEAHHTPSMWRVKEAVAESKLLVRDFCIPVNGYFPPAKLLAELQEDLPQLLKYYPTTTVALGRRLADVVGLPEEQLVLGNGSTELISWIDQLFVRERLAIPVPTFSRWTDDPRLRGVDVVTLQRQEKHDFKIGASEFVRFVLSSGARTAVICNPNNPTGALMSVEELSFILSKLESLDLVVVDESFLDFACEGAVPTVAHLVERYSNLLVLKSLGKNFGLHGVRLGYAVTATARAKELRDRLPFWNINGLAESLLKRLPAYLDQYEAARVCTVQDARAFERELRTIPSLRVFPSFANFVYVKVPSDVDGIALRNQLLEQHGLLVRECGNKEGSSKQFFRFAARPADERVILVTALREALAHRPQ